MSKRKKKRPPNPLPCGCAVVGYPELEAYGSDYELRIEYKDLHVKHCSLHAAAPDLLEQLVDAHKWLAGSPYRKSCKAITLGDLLGNIEAALAKATDTKAEERS